MGRKFSPEQVLAILCLLTAGLVLLVWIPLDVESGYLDRVRRRWVMGDKFAPSFAAVIMLVSSIALFFERSKSDITLTAQSLRWILYLVLVLISALLLMRFVGPVITSLFGIESGYRPLRDTIPWKYLGFLAGGTVMIAGLICVVERRLSWRRIVLAFVASLIMALLYDLPFEDLVLPPNGDV